MEQLRRAVEAVRGGDPALLLIEGEAGIGKTRLVTEAVAQLGAPTDLAATGGGFALGGDEIPFVAASGVVRALVRELGPAAVLEAGGPALGVLAPELTAGDREHDRGDVLSAVVGLVERLARDRMLWLVFEDLHWVDSSSRELIGYLVSAIGPCQVLMICTRRTHDRPPGPQLLEFVSELVRHPRGRRMTLDRLTASEVAEQVADLVGGVPEPGFAEGVSARSQGNPFLTEELVGAAGDGHSVSELMLSRVQGLNEEARRVVEAAAVGDGHAGHSLLTRVSGLPDHRFSSALASAMAAAVLETDPSGDRYVFRHALLREAVDKALLPTERMQWHRRWAEELEADAERLEDGPAQIAAAQHWFATDDPLRAFDAGVKAENAAWAMRASVEQARLCLRLVDLLSVVPEKAHAWQNVRIDFVWTAIGALTRTGDWAEQLALAERELEQPEATSAPAWRVYLELVRRDCAACLGGTPVEPLDVDADVAELLAAPPDNLVTTTLLWYREVLGDLGRHAEAALLLDRASEVSDAMLAEEMAGIPPGNNPPDGVSTVMKSKMMIEVQRADQEWFEGRSDEALARVGSLMPLARRPGAFDGPDHVVYRVYASMLTRLGRCREAVDVSREAIRLLGPVESNRMLWLAAMVPLAESLFAVGDWNGVDDLLQPALVGVGPHTRATADLAVISAALCCARGELDAADGWLAPVATRAAEGHRDLEMCPYRWLLAEVAAARGDVARAREHLEPCWDWPEREVEWCLVADLLLLAARLEADAPDDGTPDRVARIRERADRRVRRGDLGIAWSAHLEAELLRATGSTDPRPWSDAEAAWGRIEHPHQQGWALLRQAECLVAGGDREDAAAPLRRALQIGQRLGARPLVDAAAGLARRARLAVGGPSVPRQRGSSLTDRELDVLRLLADGCSNARIAEALFISPKTASVHVSHILTKLDVSTRTEAAAVAIRRQLLDEDGS